MLCPRCSTENPEEAQFCLNCGAKLSLICPRCGRGLPPHARFCLSCGSGLSVITPAAAGESVSAAKRLERLVPKEFAERLLATRGQVAKERRIVTILFSDVKGSTTMAEGLDPEDVMEIMDGAFDVLIEPVYRYEGTLARLMGDAILAFFGAPITHEDDPERACRAALEIIEGAKRYAAKLEDERGIKGFDVRVGINTGLVVVGEVGSDLRVEYTAMGDAINLAARMESAAEPGTVLITENTHKRVAPLFETKTLGPIQVKGKAEPVPVYRIFGAKAVPEKLRGVAGLESPLVGRETEFAALREAVERLQAGVGGIVTLVGEAGLGKSRLVVEARRDVAPEGLDWVEGRCLSYGTSVAYLLWLDVLRGLLGVTAEGSPEAARDALRERVQGLCTEHFENVYPYLVRIMSLRLEAEDEVHLRDLSGENLKTNTFRAAEILLRCAAEQKPLAIVCEDLHWADPTSIELLETLLALTDRTSVLFICILRPLKEHGSWRIKESAARTYGHRHTDLWLQALAADESQELVSNLLEIPGLLGSFQDRVLEHAEGNPLYVEEIIRSLIDRGDIVTDEASGSWRATQDVADIPIPDTLHGVLMARIDHLQEDTKRVLQMASVIGRVFLYQVLEAIAEDERELDSHLLTLQREQMIRERARIPELEYIFKHELTREAAYNGLLKVDRRAFHRQVAEALEGLFPERIEEHAGLLAHHWERAGDAGRATEYLLRAGDQARLAYAHQEAVDYYERALAFLKEQGQHEPAARTLMKLGLTYHTAFRFKESRQAYQEGFVLWQQVAMEQPVIPPPPAPHAFRVPSSEPRTLDPAICLILDSAFVIDQLFSGLVTHGPELDVVPDVARTWEVLGGGCTYVFHLRDDVRWSDGTRVMAADFEYAWKRVLDPVIGSPNGELLYAVRGARAFHRGEGGRADVGVRAADEATLVVELEGPTGYFPHLLSHTATYPVPRHVVETYGQAWTEVDNIATNGPFRLAAWHRGESIVLVRNPEYHARFAGNVERVEIALCGLGESAVGQEMYEDDALDILLNLAYLPSLEMDRSRQRHAGEYVSLPQLSTEHVGFCVTRPPFDDPRVRRAFVLATDREALAEVARQGHASPATGGFVPPGMPGHSPGIGLPYDPEEARQLLAQAGYAKGSGFPSVGLLAVHNQPSIEYLQTQWRQNLEIEVTVETVNMRSLCNRLHAGEPPHISITAWMADYPDPDSFLGASHLKPHTRWQDEAYDRLVEEARRVMDHGERMKLYRQADRILVEEGVILPLTYARLHLLVKPWVRRLPTSPIGHWSWRDVIIEPH